jgi:hypothetical protein
LAGTGKRNQFEICQSILFSTRLAPGGAILEEPKLLGFYQSQTYLGKETYPTIISSSHPVPPVRGKS